MNTLAYPSGIPSSDPVIRFYAIMILLGGLTALFLSNYRAYKDNKDFHYFYIIFIVAFPAGILGARIWYYIASYSTEFANQPFYKIFAIWEGGLAIQGGAIGGVLVGVIMALLTKKDNPILRITDYCLPTILIAQAIGRWGNFFNQEVFGHAVSLDAWNFLPSFITNNMQNGTSSMLSGVKLPSNSIAAPLFLIEGVMNIMFYFLITYGYRIVAGKKYYLDGDQSILYFLAYGIVRLMLEPLRNAQFIMGVTSSNASSKSDYRSFIMAIVFIAVAVVLLLANHITIYFLNKKNIKSPLHSYDRNNEFIRNLKFENVDNSKPDKIASIDTPSDDNFLEKLKNKENNDEK